jgi:hypothetical protein
VHDDRPFFELHGREGVAQMVDRIQDVTVGGDASVVLKVLERLFK